MRKTKNKELLLAENRVLKSQIRGNSFSLALSALFKWGSLSFIAYVAKEALIALAGKLTIADIRLKSDLFNIECKWVLLFGSGIATAGLFVGAIGIGFGKWQLKMKKDIIESKDARIKFLEKEFDSKRSTSNLTSRGDTNSGDRE